VIQTKAARGNDEKLIINMYMVHNNKKNGSVNEMKKFILVFTFALIFLGIFPTNINGEYSDFILDPQKPEVSVRRGESVDGHFNIVNTGNHTLEGVLTVDQFPCGHSCPTIQLLSDSFIYLQQNESTRIDFRINSKWCNDVQELTFHINLKNEDFLRIDIVVNVNHNYLHYSLCLFLITFLIIGLIMIISKIRKRK